MLSLSALPEELLIQIVSCLGVNDVLQLRLASKLMKEMVSVQFDDIQEREERERQWRLLKEEHNKSGFRAVESAVDEVAFEQGVKDGYVKYCNSGFIDGQWMGYELLCTFICISSTVYIFMSYSMCLFSAKKVFQDKNQQ